MSSTIDNPGCKRVKFKSVAQPSTSTQNGSECIEQQKLININDNCLPSFKSCNLLILLLLVLSCYSANASAIDDLYRSRAKRHTNDEMTELSVTRQDTVCNQGGNNECVCNRSLGNLDDQLLICDRLLEEKQLTVISMVMRNINLDVKLHTNEPYQQYFRRRIANIVSQYCEHKANECPGAILSLNRNNVIILRVNYLTPQKTEIQLVVAKESMPKKLTDATLIDPKKVKDILLSQLAPLSRVLGGVQIEKLRLVEIDRRKAAAQNNGLIKLLIIISILMAICYIIACAKVCRDSIEKRRAKKNDAMLAEKNKRNYGSCTDKLLATCEAPNGKVKSTSIKSRVSANSSSKDRRTSSADRRSTTHSSKRSNNNNEDLTSITIDTNRQDISQPETSPASCATDSRSFQRMFACDLSQLPAEDDLIDEQDPDAVFLDEPFEAQTSPKQNYIENAEIHSYSVDNTPNVSNNRRPPVVPIVIASGSQFSIDKDVDKEVEKPEVFAEKSGYQVEKPEYTHQDSSESIDGINKYFQQTKSPLLSAISEMPFDRPLSRRGSRDSTPEKGHEEFDDDVSVDSLQPWGDKPSESPQQRRQMLPNPEITFDQSSSESEDETNEVYHKLKEDDEVDQRDLKNEEVDKTDEQEKLNGENEPNKDKSENLEQRDECSGSDEELLNENRMLERHSYQRLEESPLPSPSIYTNNNSVDNSKKLMKTKSSEDAVNNLNEEIDDEEDLR